MSEAIAWINENATTSFILMSLTLLGLYALQGQSERERIREHAEEIEAQNNLVPTGPGLRMVPQFQQVIIRPTAGRALRLSRQTIGCRYYIDGKEVTHAEAVSHGIVKYNPRKD